MLQESFIQYGLTMSAATSDSVDHFFARENPPTMHSNRVGKRMAGKTPGQNTLRDETSTLITSFEPYFRGKKASCRGL